MPPAHQHTEKYAHRPTRMGDIQVGAVLAVLFGLLAAGLAWLLIGRTGVTTVMTLLGVVVLGAVFSYLAWRNLVVLVCIWLFAMSGFRAYAMIPMPVLPDLSLERIIAIWLVILFSFRLLMRHDRLHGPWLVDIILLLHALYVLANVTYIGDRGFTHFWTLSSMSPLIGYFIGKQVTNRDKDVKYLFMFMSAVMVYYFVQSIAQKYDLNFLIWPKGILDLYKGIWPVGRSRGPFLHPPLFGQVMAMLLPFLFYFFFRFRSRIGKALMLLCIVLGGLGLLYTYTRGPWLAAAVGLVALGVMRPHFRQLLTAMAVLVAMTAFFGILQNLNSELLQERFQNTETVGNRLAAMSASFRMWRDNPVFGIGWFNWDIYYPKYLRGEEIPFYGYITQHTARGVVIHDIYWGRLAEEGLFSIALLTAAVGLVWFRFKRLWAVVHDSDWLNRDGLATIAGVVIIYAVGGAAIDYRYFDLVNALPYFLAGIIMGYRVPEHPLPPDPYANWTPPRFRSDSDQDRPTAPQV